MIAVMGPSFGGVDPGVHTCVIPAMGGPAISPQPGLWQPPGEIETPILKPLPKDDHFPWHSGGLDDKDDPNPKPDDGFGPPDEKKKKEWPDPSEFPKWVREQLERESGEGGGG